MPYNGTGIFQRIYSWVTDASNSVPVSADRTDEDSDDIASGLSNCVTRDGQSVWLANLPAGGYKITGLGNGSLPADSVNYAQVFSSPAFVTPTATTSPSLGDSSLRLATTAFVASQIASATLPGQLGNAGKEIKTDGSIASWGYFSVRDARTANTMLVQADNRKFIDITGGVAFTQTVDLAANLGNGWSVRYRNKTSNIITMPLADGVTTKLIPGATVDLLCNGTTFNLVPVNENRPRVTVVLTTTGANAWTPPYDCVATVMVTGSGGGGLTRTGAFDGSTSAASAGTAIKFNLSLSASVTYTATVAAAPAASATPTSTAGSASSFSGSGISTITANGGAGAVYLASGSTSVYVPAAGGTASGGDINLTGQSGFASFGLPNLNTGAAVGGNLGVMGGANTLSYWGNGYGAGAAGVGAAYSTSEAGKQGVIVIEYE